MNPQTGVVSAEAMQLSQGKKIDLLSLFIAYTTHLKEVLHTIFFFWQPIYTNELRLSRLMVTILLEAGRDLKKRPQITCVLGVLVEAYVRVLNPSLGMQHFFRSFRSACARVRRYTHIGSRR